MSARVVTEMLADSMGETLALDPHLATPVAAVMATELLEWLAERGVIQRCHYCQKPVIDRDKTKDHIVPRSKGGTSKSMNLVPSCRPCNWRKAAQDPDPNHCERCQISVRWHLRRARRLEHEARDTNVRFAPFVSV